MSKTSRVDHVQPRWFSRPSFVSAVTSGAASAGVADLEAAPEVAQTKSIKYELEPASAKAFSSMQLLEGKSQHDTIATTYSDGTLFIPCIMYLLFFVYCQFGSLQHSTKLLTNP